MLSGCSLFLKSPTASFTATTSENSLLVIFDATSSTSPNGEIVKYEWVFGDGHTATGPDPDHTYASPGTYTVKLTVTDEKGAVASKTKQVDVNITDLFALFTTSPNKPVVNEQVTFDGSHSTGDIDSYNWWFKADTDPSATATGETATYTYTQTGSYKVKLTVESSYGLSTFRRSLEVKSE